MHDHVAVVEQHPRRRVESLDAAWGRAAVTLHRGFDLLADGAHLSCVRAARDHERLGDPDDVPDIEDEDVLALLVGCGSRRDDGTSMGVQVGVLQVRDRAVCRSGSSLPRPGS